jgi:thioredoxin reductase (NADPH)
MMTASAEASDIIGESLIRRVNFRRDVYVSSNVTEAAIIGDRYDLACHDLRDFLSRNQILYEWLDPSVPGDANSMPPGTRDASRYPIVVLPNGHRLDVPTMRELADALKLQTTPLSDTYDVAIVGGGPAGLAAAVYGGSEGLRTIMIEREAPGGQAGTSSRIENYLGFPGGISGNDLANRALLQAKRFGTEILVTRSVDQIESSPEGHTIVLDGGDRVPARAVVVATGVCWRQLDCTGAAELVGRGVYYGAARTEALGTRGKDVFLIGGGNSAGQAAMFFSSYARSVTLLVRGSSLAKSMSHYLIEQLATKRNIAVETGTTVVSVAGRSHIESITTRVEATGAVQERHADGLFAFIGADADTDWLPPALERDARGYLRTGRDIETWRYERRPFPLETSVPGIFSAGDVRSESVKRVASSVGEGSMVIAYIHQYLTTG